MSRPAVFLDRDGTLIRDRVHAADPATVQPLPGVVDALRALRGAGYALVVASNNSGVARGLFTVSEALAMGTRLVAVLSEAGVKLDGYYVCPHHPSEGRVARYAQSCGCRKPEPGMLLRAAEELDIDLSRSWMVGDLPSDVGAGLAAGARTVLLDVGCLSYDDADEVPDEVAGAAIARNLAHAAALILATDSAPPLPDELMRPPDELRSLQEELTTLPDELKASPDELKSLQEELTTLPDELNPLPLETLVRPVGARAGRAPGTPSLYPDEPRLVRAGIDGRLLYELLAAGGASSGRA